MPPVFKTREDAPQAVTIPGGLLGPYGSGGVALTDAAAAGFTELCVTDDRGYAVRGDDDQLQPLTGAELTAAGRDVAAARGWVVENVKAADLDVQIGDDGTTTSYAQRELGLTHDRPPAAQTAQEEYERIYGGIEPLNTDPEQLAQGVEAGDPAAPDAGLAGNSPGDDTTTPQEG